MAKARAPIGTRVFASGTLALALTSLLTSLVHMGVVRHERCAEHGELIEVAGPIAAHDVALEADATGDEEGDHDHCPLATPTSLSPAPSVLARMTAVLAAADSVRPSATLVVAHDVLGFAPKTSPPALA